MIGVILTAVSLIGYYNGQKYLTQSIEQEMDAIVDFKADEVDGWLLRKAQNVVTVANTLEHLDAATGARREMLSAMEGDMDLLNLYNGTQEGRFVQWVQSEVPAGFDPRTRGWYKEAVAKDAVTFTDAYVDVITGKQVVSAAMAYKNALGQVQGVVGADIALDVLKQQVEQIWFSGKITQPVLALTAHADELARGNLGLRRLETGSRDEIGRLGAAFSAMSENLRNLIRQMAASSEHVTTASAALSSSASQSAEAANHVTETITQVAAGMAGKGFAVVAEEVRKLAEQSQQATEEIGHLIATIQADTARAVETMASGKAEVETGAGAICTVSSAFGDILRMVGKITVQVEEITAFVRQVSDASKEVVTAVGEINAVSKNTAAQTQTISAATEQQSASMEEIASSVQTLSQMAQEMRAMIGKFKL